MKTAGLVLLCALFALCGFFKSAQHKRRLQLRGTFADWLGDLGFSIGGKCESFTHFLERCAADKTYDELCFVGELSRRLAASRALCPSFEEAYAGSELAGVLLPREEQALAGIFSRIASGASEGAVQLVNELRGELCVSVGAEKSEQSGKSRLLISLYSMCGFAVAILLA